MKDERCETCRFARDPGGEGTVRCRRYAPRPRLEPMFVPKADDIWIGWPCVLGDDWCGEYQPAELEEESDG